MAHDVAHRPPRTVSRSWQPDETQLRFRRPFSDTQQRQFCKCESRLSTELDYIRPASQLATWPFRFRRPGIAVPVEVREARLETCIAQFPCVRDCVGWMLIAAASGYAELSGLVPSIPSNRLYSRRTRLLSCPRSNLRANRPDYCQPKRQIVERNSHPQGNRASLWRP